MRDLPCARLREFADFNFKGTSGEETIVGARKLKLICELQPAGNDHLATRE